MTARSVTAPPPVPVIFELEVDLDVLGCREWPWRRCATATIWPESPVGSVAATMASLSIRQTTARRRRRRTSIPPLPVGVDRGRRPVGASWRRARRRRRSNSSVSASTSTAAGPGAGLGHDDPRRVDVGELGAVRARCLLGERLGDGDVDGAGGRRRRRRLAVGGEVDGMEAVAGLDLVGRVGVGRWRRGRRRRRTARGSRRPRTTTFHTVTMWLRDVDGGAQVTVTSNVPGSVAADGGEADERRGAVAGLVGVAAVRPVEPAAVERWGRGRWCWSLCRGR